MNKDQGNTLIEILVIILSLFVLLVGLPSGIDALRSFFSKAGQETKTQVETIAKKETSKEKPSAQPTLVNLNESVQKLSTELVKTFKGELQFSDPYRSEVPRYSQNISFPGGNVRLIVYKYNPGQILNAGYEGSRWTVSMDTWVNYLSTLQIGQTSAKRVDYWGGESKTEQPILVKQIGKNLYGIYDSDFKPAASCSRYFMTYDKINKQIINIAADTGCEGAKFLKDSAIFEFPKISLDYFNEVEKVMSSIQ